MTRPPCGAGEGRRTPQATEKQTNSTAPELDRPSEPKTGVGYRKEHHSAWLRGAAPDCAEIIADHFFSRPEALSELGKVTSLVFHDVGLSVGTEGPLDTAAVSRLVQIQKLIKRSPPLLFSDHLAATRSPSGLDLGHLFPFSLTSSSLEAVTDKVKYIQAQLEVPVALENLAFPFLLPNSTFSEAEFLTELVTLTGCGLLLDLTNLLYNCRNFGLDPLVELQNYPLQAVWQVHLAGGVQRDGFWHDSHSAPVEKESFELLSELTKHVTPQVVIIERDQSIPNLSELHAEATLATRYITKAGQR